MFKINDKIEKNRKLLYFKRIKEKKLLDLFKNRKIFIYKYI